MKAEGRVYLGGRKGTKEVDKVGVKMAVEGKIRIKSSTGVVTCRSCFSRHVTKIL